MLIHLPDWLAVNCIPVMPLATQYFLIGKLFSVATTLLLCIYIHVQMYVCVCVCARMHGYV